MSSVKRGDLVSIMVGVLDLRGNLVAQTDEEGVHVRAGMGDTFPRLDAALIGRNAGESFEVVLEPEDSFGDFDETLVHLVPVELLGADNPRKGMRFSNIPGVPTDGGRAYILTDLGGGMAVLDGNHPYAGWTLRFAVKVLRVEEVAEGDVSDADIFVPDFLKPPTAQARAEAQERYELERARKRLEEAAEDAPEEPDEPLGHGLFTSLVPKDPDKRLH